MALCVLQIKPLSLRPVKVSEDEVVQELSRPHRSNSKEQLSEVSQWMRTFPFSQTSYREPGYPFSQANAGNPWGGIKRTGGRLQHWGWDQRAAGAVAPAVHSLHLIKPLCIGIKTDWLVAHRQEMIRPVTQHHLLGLALLIIAQLNVDMTRLGSARCGLTLATPEWNGLKKLFQLSLHRHPYASPFRRWVGGKAKWKPGIGSA